MLVPSDYLDDIKLTAPIVERIETIIKFYEDLLPETVNGIFVSETKDSDGQTIYSSLWLFTQQFICEAHDFLTIDSFDSATLQDQFKHWILKQESFTLGAATTKSRMSLRYTTIHGSTGVLQASGLNCEHLHSVLKEIVVPNTRND